MASNAMVYIVILWSILLIMGVRDAKLSKYDEDLELERQLKLLNKPSIKTIETKYGDIYDCMDFYKQPAFDHPLLKNHNFYPEMRPSFNPKWRTKPTKFPTQLESMKLKDGGCPKGYVPIKRVTKDYLIQMKRLSKQFASSAKTDSVQPKPDGSYVAVVQSKSNGGTAQYKGVGGSIGVFNLSVGPSQFSSSQFILQNGIDTIRVGLMANPSLHKDNLTRMFQHVDAGQLHCFNTLCPGFVSLRKDLPIDSVIEPVSKLQGNKLYQYKFLVFQVFGKLKDQRNGNWWLEVEKMGYTVGFWPSKIFSALTKSSSYIAVGGVAYSPPGQPLPPMGSGLYPYCSETGIDYSGFCSGFIVVDSNYDMVNPNNTQVYTNNKEYVVLDVGFTPAWGRLVCFGGPW